MGPHCARTLFVAAVLLSPLAGAEFTENEKGTLESGKLADLAVLSQDIFEVAIADLPNTRSVFTLVGGKIVYDAKILAIHRAADSTQ
jgi:hypothetical protein